MPRRWNVETKGGQRKLRKQSGFNRTGAKKINEMLHNKLIIKYGGAVDD